MCFSNNYCLSILPAVTRFTVYRRLQIKNNFSLAVHRLLGDRQNVREKPKRRLLPWPPLEDCMWPRRRAASR